jgi:hypothetical protein
MVYFFECEITITDKTLKLIPAKMHAHDLPTSEGLIYENNRAAPIEPNRNTYR